MKPTCPPSAIMGTKRYQPGGHATLAVGVQRSREREREREYKTYPATRPKSDAGFTWGRRITNDISVLA